MYYLNNIGLVERFFFSFSSTVQRPFLCGNFRIRWTKLEYILSTMGHFHLKDWNYLRWALGTYYINCIFSTQWPVKIICKAKIFYVTLKRMFWISIVPTVCKKREFVSKDEMSRNWCLLKSQKLEKNWTRGLAAASAAMHHGQKRFQKWKVLYFTPK